MERDLGRKTSSFLILLLIILLLSGCQPKDAQVDYASLEKTASLHLTQTFEALPTATHTFTPMPTNTPLPTDTPEPTATDTPEPEEEELIINRGVSDDDPFMISRPEDTGEEFLLTHPEIAEPTSTPEPTATVYFPDKADFVFYLPSPNQFVPNQHFYLTWQIKNIGTSTWSGKYKLYYSKGIQLADQNTYEITGTVAPGETLTITMPATAPSELGTYETQWTFENPNGIPFYYLNFIAIVGEQTFITNVPELNPSATPSALSWMCSDAERSLVQGDGCTDYCSAPVVEQMQEEGKFCYAYGESVEY